MQSLLLAPDLFLKIDDGSKRATIRLGERSILLGPLKLISSEDANVAKNVTVHTTYTIVWKNLSQKEADLDGYRDADHLRQELRRFYPDAKDEDILTVIQYDI